jgi:hypothetical protein
VFGHPLSLMINIQVITMVNRHIRTVIVAPMTTARKNYPSRVSFQFQNKKWQIVLDRYRSDSTVSALHFDIASAGVNHRFRPDRLDGFLVMPTLPDIRTYALTNRVMPNPAVTSLYSGFRQSLPESRGQGRQCRFGPQRFPFWVRS